MIVCNSFEFLYCSDLLKHLSCTQIQSALGHLSLDEENMDGYGNVSSVQMQNHLEELPASVTYVTLAVTIIIILTSVLGNGLILYTIYKVPSLRTISSSLVANLAVTDLCVSSFILPMVGVTIVNRGWKLNQHLCTAVGFLDGILTKAQIMALLCIGINRYVAVHRPTFYSSAKNKRFCKWCVIFSWVFSFAWSLPPLFGVGAYSYTRNTLFCGLAWNSRTAFEAVHISVTAILPGLAGLFIYSSVLIGVFRHIRQVNSNLRTDVMEMKEIGKNQAQEAEHKSVSVHGSFV